jgi:DNA adenine methylase
VNGIGMKGVLRYPGGKTKALDKILPHIPLDIQEFREPFVGGGSVFIASKQRVGNIIFKINDLNYDLYCFWKILQEQSDELIEAIVKIKNEEKDGKKLHKRLTDDETNWNDFERATRFFVLNRITFSGTVDSGGYSQQAFERRFTDSSIERLKPISTLLQGIQITNYDYQKLLNNDGKDVFIFLDPPYLQQQKSRLYGKNGDLHLNFDHRLFAEDMKKCKHKWLITLDNSPGIRDLFDFAHTYEWELQYGMNNYKQEFSKKGNELFISNYELDMVSVQKRITKNSLKTKPTESFASKH